MENCTNKNCNRCVALLCLKIGNMPLPDLMIKSEISGEKYNHIFESVQRINNILFSQSNNEKYLTESEYDMLIKDFSFLCDNGFEYKKELEFLQENK